MSHKPSVVSSIHLPIAYKNYYASRDFVSSVLVFLVVVGFFLPCLGFTFLNFDDGEYVYHSAFVTTNLSWRSIYLAFCQLHTVNWHPITSLSHLLDYHFFGLNPAWHHFSSVMAQAASASLLYILIRQLAFLSRVGSIFLVLFFSIHPMRLESVVWISERKDVLSVFFLLASINLYCFRARRFESNFPVYGASFLCFVLACLSKSSVVMGAPLLALVSWWPLKRFVSKWRTCLLELTPFFVVSLIVGVVTICAHSSQGNLASVHGFGWYQRISVALFSSVVYLGKFFWPQPISIFYPMQDISLGMTACNGLLFVLISGFAVLLVRSKPYILFGWFWCLLAIAPVSGVLQNGGQLYADRYSYLPHCGLILSAAFFLSDINYRVRANARLVWLASICILGCLGWRCSQEMAYWKNSESIWMRATQQTNNNFVAYINLTSEYINQNNFVKAKPFALLAHSMVPNNELAISNLATVYLKLGEVSEAHVVLSKALHGAPESHQLRAVTAELLLMEGKVVDALKIVTSVNPRSIPEDYFNPLLRRLVGGGNGCQSKQCRVVAYRKYWRSIGAGWGRVERYLRRNIREV
jgi:protein O-mannosyl-transferase